MGEMSKYSPDEGLTVLDIKDANTRKSIAPILTSTTAPSDITVGKEFYLPDMKLYKATAFIASGGTITEGTNCELADSVTDQINDRLTYADNGVLGARNFIPFPFDRAPQTISSVYFNYDKDGIITASGTTTGSVNFYLVYSRSIFKVGRYKFKFYGTLTNAYVRLYDVTGSTIIGTANASNKEFTFEITSSNVEHQFSIFVAVDGTKNININGGVVISLATDTYDGYTVPTKSPQ